MLESDKKSIAIEKAAVDRARMMRDFADSEMGQGFQELLREQYASLVTQACSESKYASSFTALENMAKHMGSTLDRGVTARQKIERLLTQTPIENY
jgi:hypothetical protein